MKNLREREREHVCRRAAESNVYTLINSTLKADGLLLTGSFIKFLGIWPIRKGMEDLSLHCQHDDWVFKKNWHDSRGSRKCARTQTFKKGSLTLF